METMETMAHDVLLKNAMKALKNLSKDNSVSLEEVLVALNYVKDYLDDLIWDVEEEIEADWIEDSIDQNQKCDFDDEGY